MKAREQKQILYRLEYIDDFLFELHHFSKHISTKEDFLKDRSTQIIVSKQIQDIGEAIRIICKKIRPEIIIEYPKIEWLEIVELRNRIAHESFQIKIDTIYKALVMDIRILEEELPKFKNYVLSQKKGNGS